MRMGLIDLDHRDVIGPQRAGQPGRIRAGRLHRDRLHPPERAQPRDQLLIARRGHIKLLGGQQHPARVQDRGMMSIGVRVDPADHDRGLILRHAVHSRPPVRAGGLVGKGGQNSDEALG